MPVFWDSNWSGVTKCFRLSSKSPSKLTCVWLLTTIKLSSFVLLLKLCISYGLIYNDELSAE